MEKADKPAAARLASMTPERWERVKNALAQVLAAPVSSREEAIREACGGDTAMERDVRELLAQAGAPGESTWPIPAGTEDARSDPGLPIEPDTLIAGRFRIGRLLGRGGMGQVWEAFDEQLRIPVAIKTLRPELMLDGKAVERFQREILTARSVSHPNICRVYDLCVHDGEGRQIPFLTMQLIAGESLAERLRRGPLAKAEAIAILEQCALALEAAHREGVIHRDFKPANVMLSTGDAGKVRAVVMDFGLARQACPENEKSGTAGGTPGYMAPEQMTGKEVHPSSDVYAFAVVACELLTGKRPSEGGLEAVPPGWRTPLRNGLDVDPARRISSALELLKLAQSPRRRVPLPFAWAVAAIFAIAAIWAGWAWRARPAEATLAVLPFDLEQKEPELQYLGDGIAEELINSLTRRPRLRVIARGSSFNYRGKSGDLKGASAALGVRYMVVGSVRRQSGHIRISVEVVDPKTGFQVWASNFDRPENEIFEVQEIVASEIASRLIGVQAASGNRAPQTINPEAHDLYLRGIFHFNHRTREETLLALDLLQQAIRKAPDYAPLYTALADCYSVLGDYRYKTPLEVMEPARAAIRRAIELDPELAEAHASLGLWANVYGWDNKLSEENFRKAISLNPGYVPAHQWYSQLLYKTRRFEEARREAERALELDPISPAVNLNYGNLFYYSRDFAGLLRQSLRQREINTALPFSMIHQALALAWLGRSGEAVAVMERAQPMRGEDPQLVHIWAEVLAVGGDQIRAREALERLVALYQQGKAPAGYVAMIYALLQEPDRACDYLEKAVGERDSNLTIMDVAPPYDNLRTNPRFLGVRAQVFKETKATN